MLEASYRFVGVGGGVKCQMKYGAFASGRTGQTSHIYSRIGYSLCEFGSKAWLIGGGDADRAE